MRPARFFFPIVFASFFTIATAQALSIPPVIPPWKVPSPQSLLKVIPKPPAPGSAAAAADLAEVLRLQATATPAQIARARWTYDLSVFTFGEVMAGTFSRAMYPKTAAFFLGLNNLVQKENNYLKNHYRRPHPFQVAPGRVKEFVHAPTGFSYPSYHSARCVVFAKVLATLDPAGKADFLRVARQVEVDRVLAGEHFPSDIRAGIQVGRLIYAALEKDGNFVAAVRQLKAEEWTPPPILKKDVVVLVP